MSYDLVVWTRGGPSSFTETLKNESFTPISSDHWECAAKNWMISVAIDPVADEDIPDDLYARVRGITHHVSVHVMPSGAPASAKTKARRLARTMAEVGQGAVQDLQTDQLSVAKSARPKSIKAGKSEVPQTSHAILSLVWCMNHSKVMTPDGVNQLFDVLTRFLPEALPRRYGPHEPLRFELAKMGKAHFIQTYCDDPGTSIYCKQPAISLSLPSFAHGYRKTGAEKRYWVNEVAMTLDARVLNDPVWAAHLPKAFVAISRCLQPFYGEARRLRGYEIARNGALLFKTRDVPETANGMSEPSPVSPWWAGIPRTPAIACVIGSPYLDLWTDRKGWDELDGLSVFQGQTWDAEAAAYNIPPALAQRPAPIVDIQSMEDLKQHQENEALPQPIFPF